MNQSRVRAIVMKDLMEIIANRMVVVSIFVVPLVLCILLPAVVTFLALKLDLAAINGAELIERILPAYAIPNEFTTSTVRIAYVFLNYTFVPLFMLVPIIMASTIAANSFVGEKERRTLETLLYTPVSNQELVVAKHLSAFLPAVVISTAGFAGYFATVNGISFALTGLWLVRSPVWIPAILLVSPAVSLLVLDITLMISMRAKTFMEAQQMSAIIVIPFLLLVVIQLTGLVILNIFAIVVFGLIMAMVDLALLRVVAPRFNREKILKTL